MPYINAVGRMLRESAPSTRWVTADQSGRALTGSGLNETLSGGADYTLIGGDGDDIYGLTGPAIIREAVNGGVDTMSVWASAVLQSNVENLVMNGGYGWYAIGNDLDNIITGTGGRQQIDGAAGNDVLIGGSGADLFVMSRGNGSDLIVDFGNGADQIRLAGYGLHSFDDVLAIARQTGNDVVLNLTGGEILVLQDVRLATLTARDFLLEIDLSQYTRTFSEEFDGLRLSVTGGIWDTFYNHNDRTSFFSRYHSGEAQVYVDSLFAGTAGRPLGLNPFTIANGVLTISAAPVTADAAQFLGGQTYTSGLLTTASSFAQQYGYFEIRAALPAGQGFWPAFWLLPEDGSWPPEIDVFEMLGNDPNTVHYATHTVENGQRVGNGGHYRVDTTEFHVYGVDWGPQNITFYLDGVAIGQVPTPDSMHRPFYMLLNLAVGGTWGGAPDHTTGTGLMQVDYVRAWRTADTTQITGDSGDNVLRGGSGNDILSGGRGSDAIDGGTGIDMILLDGRATAYSVMRMSDGGYRATGFGETDTIVNVERVSFDGGVTSISVAEFEQQAFDPFAYMVANPDIYAAFGSNGAAAARSHYFASGVNEGRNPGTFDALAYVASNFDLVRAIGTNLARATEHYVVAGRNEGLATNSFNALTYAASNPDLARAFGTDIDAATRHYICAGFYEGRLTSSFNALLYAASNPDLARSIGLDATGATIDYLTSGLQSGRPTNTFDPLIYAASNPDLARAFGADAGAALFHYLGAGANEGRRTTGFDPLAYSAANPDLASFFGTDGTGALRHYLNAGVREGRTTSGFDGVAYLLTYGNLAGLGASGALNHWLVAGADEGRIGDALFGREQATHQFGRVTSGTLEQATDRDWFQTSFTGGNRVTINLTGSATTVELYDALGNRIPSAAGQTSNVFDVTTTGSYFIVVFGAAGTFTLSTTVGIASALVSPAIETILKDAGPLVQPGLEDDIVGKNDPDSDAFVLPMLDDLPPLVLPSIDDGEELLLQVFDGGLLPAGDTMLTLPLADEHNANDLDPWHRFDPNDGWVMH